MKYFERLAEESSLLHFSRVYEDGEPVGYVRRTGMDLLDASHREKFESLPARFRFVEAQKALAQDSKLMHSQLVQRLLVTAQEAGLLRKDGKFYVKVSDQSKQ